MLNTLPQVSIQRGPRREQLAAGQALALAILLNLVLGSLTHGAPNGHKDNLDRPQHREEPDNSQQADDVADLSVLDTITGPFTEEPSARGCADFWAKYNLTRMLGPASQHGEPGQAGADERISYRDLTRLSYTLKRHLASHKNFALLSYVERCQRALAPPKRLLFFLNGAGAPGSGDTQSGAAAAAAAQQVALLETLASVDDSSRQAELIAAHSRSTNASRSIESILEEIERLKRRVVGFKQAQACEDSLAAIAGGSALGRFDELREERDRCRSELELCKVRGHAEQNDLTFKLSEKDMELDICRKQSNRRLEIIKQATRMVDEMSKDMKERGIII